MPKALPVRCWQARQWQMEMRNGSPVASMVSWPQAQEAWRVGIDRILAMAAILWVFGPGV